MYILLYITGIVLYEIICFFHTVEEILHQSAVYTIIIPFFPPGQTHHFVERDAKIDADK